MNYDKKRVGILQLRNAPLFGKRRFLLIMLFWIYPAAWIGGLIYFSFFWDANWYEKAIPFILVVLGTPAIEDLLIGYRRYKKIWEEHNHVTNECSVHYETVETNS